jgi:cytochrome c biogenesis protein CcmG/thiol:disulfide interchange protein DsbE
MPLVKAAGFVHTGSMTKWFSFGILLWFVFAAIGETLKLDTLKVGTTTYSNVMVLGANSTDLYFKHSYGFANVKLKYVAPDLQKRFGYDPKTAEDAERRQTEEEVLYQTTMARSTPGKPGPTGAPKPKGSLGSETGLSDPISDKALLGKAAPALQVDKWLSEQPSLEGKFVLVSFWASWSAPCRQAIPELNALQKKYADKLTVIGVTTETEADLSQMSEPRVEYASAIDSKAKLSAAAGVTSIPYVLLTDSKGVVLYEGHPAALTDKKLEAILARPAE